MEQTLQILAIFGIGYLGALIINWAYNLVKETNVANPYREKPIKKKEADIYQEDVFKAFRSNCDLTGTLDLTKINALKGTYVTFDNGTKQRIR